MLCHTGAILQLQLLVLFRGQHQLMTTQIKTFLKNNQHVLITSQHQGCLVNINVCSHQCLLFCTFCSMKTALKCLYWATSSPHQEDILRIFWHSATKSPTWVSSDLRVLFLTVLLFAFSQTGEPYFIFCWAKAPGWTVTHVKCYSDNRPSATLIVYYLFIDKVINWALVGRHEEISSSGLSC